MRNESSDVFSLKLRGRTVLAASLVLLLGFLSVSLSCFAADRPVLLLLSLDGFRWDYLDLYPEQTRCIRELSNEGSHARELIPAFPTKTFPNHHSIATGLYPAHHGIVNNDFYDPQLKESFVLKRAQTLADARWWKGEPVWITALKEGLKTANYFWPGGPVEIAGKANTYSQAYDPKLTFAQECDQIFTWLQLPPEDRPALVTAYFSEPDTAGHHYGPRSSQVADVIRQIDERLGELVERIRKSGVTLNIILLTDHGMTETGKEQVVLLDNYIDTTSVQVDFAGPFAGLRPPPGQEKNVLRHLKGMPDTVSVYRVEDLPGRFHLSGNPRLPPLWLIAREGWEIRTRAYEETHVGDLNAADHGYDNALQSMHGIFIVNGPSFRKGVTVQSVENIHIYNLMCAVLGIKSASNDGDDRLVKALLK